MSEPVSDPIPSALPEASAAPPAPPAAPNRRDYLIVRIDAHLGQLRRLARKSLAERLGMPDPRSAATAERATMDALHAVGPWLQSRGHHDLTPDWTTIITPQDGIRWLENTRRALLRIADPAPAVVSTLKDQAGGATEVQSGESKRQEKPADDGPEPPNVVHWKGRSYELPPTLWRILNHLWSRDVVMLADLATAIWGDEGPDVPDARIRSRLSELNARLGEIGIPQSYSVNQGHIRRA